MKEGRIDKTEGPKKATHQLHIHVRGALDEKVVDADGKQVMDRIEVDGFTQQKPRFKLTPGGAIARRPLRWLLRADGSRVVEVYEDTFELMMSDGLIDIIDVREIDPAEVVSLDKVTDKENGGSYEAYVERVRKLDGPPKDELRPPRRGEAKGAPTGAAAVK